MAGTKEQQRKYDAERAARRGKNWCIVFYPDDLPSDFIEKLKTELQAPMLVSPLHDQDYTAAGDHKKAHHHIIFFFPTDHSEGQLNKLMREIFGSSEDGKAIPGVAPIIASKCIVRNRSLAVRYLAHLDDPDKARYDENEIVGYNGADPTKELVRSQAETQKIIVAMEEFIEDNAIVELADFAKAIRYTYPEWHIILTTKMTIYFSNFIRSRRHKKEKGELTIELPEVQVDPETGEVLS